MSRSWEEVDPLAPYRPITQLGETVCIPGQSGGVAGDIDDPVRGQAGQDGGHLGGQSFPGRIYANDLGDRKSVV